MPRKSQKKPAHELKVHPWTQEQIQILTQCYQTEKMTVLAARLGRSPGACYGRLKNLGLSKPRWKSYTLEHSKEEVALLHSQGKSDGEIARALGGSVSRTAVRYCRRLLGLAAFEGNRPAVEAARKKARNEGYPSNGHRGQVKRRLKWLLVRDGCTSRMQVEVCGALDHGQQMTAPQIRQLLGKRNDGQIPHVLRELSEHNIIKFDKKTGTYCIRESYRLPVIKDDGRGLD